MNYSKKHLKIVQFIPVSKITTFTVNQIVKWYDQIETTKIRKQKKRG